MIQKLRSIMTGVFFCNMRSKHQDCYAEYVRADPAKNENECLKPTGYVPQAVIHKMFCLAENQPKPEKRNMIFLGKTIVFLSKPSLL